MPPGWFNLRHTDEGPLAVEGDGSTVLIEYDGGAVVLEADDALWLGHALVSRLDRSKP